MAYPEDLAASILQEYTATQNDLEQLFLTVVASGQSISNDRAKEHILHGAARRIKLLRRCLSNVFQLFPPTTATPICSEDLDEVQISLHAFVMNLYGLFENLAWAFVVRHGLETKIGHHNHIGMFQKPTQRFLPTELVDYLNSSTMVAWHKDYLKNYRDALAHRIPLYIPPAVYTPEEGERHSALERDKVESIWLHQWDKIEQINCEQASLGSVCLVFLHSYSDSGLSRPVYLHPQMICDAKTVLEFCPLFFTHWHENA